MKKNKFPKGWDEKRVRKMLTHYEKQNEVEAVEEDKAAFKDPSQTVIVVPNTLVPVVRELIARHESSQTRRHPRKPATNKT